jgi:TDG/mug DNA glycosylase family protein
LPLALADLHRSLTVGAPLDIQVLGGDYEGEAHVNDDVGGRFFCGWRIDRLRDVLLGAGFDVQTIEPAGDAVRARARRLLTLPDFVGAGMRILVVGLNPSIFAAEAGVGFARPSNRFWKAAIAAGLVTCANDPRDALARHGVGMTDLVKRATVSATDLRVEEYRAGMERIERLVSWLEPRALCMVGLSGWRAAVDRSAETGVQKGLIGGRPVYVMPSTSGANAHTNPLELTAHLRETAALGGC